MLKVGDKAVLPDGLMKKLKNHSPLMITFYKFDCPTCQFTFRFLPRIAKEVGENHFVAIGQDEPAEISEFKNEYKIGFEILSDPHPYKLSLKYGFDYVPTFFVVEADLTITAVGEGFDKRLIENFANRIAAANNVASFQAFKPTEQVPLLKPG
jgi:thiol-disulfide isomerase/thioredoxin